MGPGRRNWCRRDAVHNSGRCTCDAPGAHGCAQFEALKGVFPKATAIGLSGARQRSSASGDQRRPHSAHLGITPTVGSLAVIAPPNPPKGEARS
jgi:hypothetical protein